MKSSFFNGYGSAEKWRDRSRFARQIHVAMQQGFDDAFFFQRAIPVKTMMQIGAKRQDLNKEKEIEQTQRNQAASGRILHDGFRLHSLLSATS